MPAVDWMGSASLGIPPEDLDVKFRQTKPPNSWVGARYDAATGEPTDDVMDFEGLEEPAVFFEGTAREAASSYPVRAHHPICSLCRFGASLSAALSQ